MTTVLCERKLNTRTSFSLVGRSCPQIMFEVGEEKSCQADNQWLKSHRSASASPSSSYLKLAFYNQYCHLNIDEVLNRTPNGNVPKWMDKDITKNVYFCPYGRDCQKGAVKTMVNDWKVYNPPAQRHLHWVLVWIVINNNAEGMWVTFQDGRPTRRPKQRGTKSRHKSSMLARMGRCLERGCRADTEWLELQRSEIANPSSFGLKPECYRHYCQ